MTDRFWERLVRLLIVILGLWLVLELVDRLIVEIFWFREVDYLSTFVKRIQIQVGLWAVASSISVLFLLGNLFLAQRLEWRSASEKVATVISNDKVPVPPNRSVRFTAKVPDSSRMPVPQSSVIRLSLLLPITITFSLLVGFILLYYSQVALSVWRPGYNLPNVTPLVPSPLAIPNLPPQILPLLTERLWQFGVIIGVAILLLTNLRFWLKAIAWALSLVFGLVLSGNWTRVLQYFSPTPFGQVDPQFGNDISVYIFGLPLWQLLNFWLGGLFLYGLVAVSLTYLLSGNSLSEGKFPGFSRLQLRHLYGLGGAVMLTVALNHWLERYKLLYSERGVSYGASYTEVKVQLPVETVLAIMAIVIAVWLLIKAITGWGRKVAQAAEGSHPQAQPDTLLDGTSRRGRGLPFQGRERMTSVRRRHLKAIPFSPLPFLVYLGIFIGGAVTADAVQRLRVEPNELALERPYIERNIALTRAAFGLNDIEARTFSPEGQLTAADIRENNLTIDNIRLWDTRPILEANRQLQQIRLYYRFPDADIDRYTLLTEPTGPEASSEEPSAPRTQKQQVIIAARELDYSAVPEQAKTWVNKHLIYTHGYGFTLSPVNLVGEGGLPFYFVKDIGTGDDEGALNTSSELIRNSIPIGRPRIYYGELTDTYVMTSTRVRELDFPSGDENVYFNYDGTGGIQIGAPWRRWLFAVYLKDWQMLFTHNFTPQTRLLFRRNINRRVREIAPFLHYDRDPYLVVADAGDPNQETEHYLYWIIDAYTTSDRYPYSEPIENKFNYIRNSVKVVIDAYNGDIDFYVANPDDPIIQTWTKIFPNLFQPLSDMPAALRSHIRYPEDLFRTQSERLLTYHMTDPQVFYNREDQWEIPQEIYGTEAQLVEPYYLIMKLPTATAEEFILLNPYTPTSRPNLIAWLAGRSDGEQYGKLLLYQFPKQRLIYGPNQIEALINQDPVISQQISLWNREGSRALQGNLLVIPIEQSLLYVEPVYLEAEINSLPTLARVIVVYENRIVMAETLEEALEAIFAPEQPSTPAIIRPAEELVPRIEGGTNADSE